MQRFIKNMQVRIYSTIILFFNKIFIKSFILCVLYSVPESKNLINQNDNQI